MIKMLTRQASTICVQSEGRHNCRERDRDIIRNARCVRHTEPSNWRLEKWNELAAEVDDVNENAEPTTIRLSLSLVSAFLGLQIYYLDDNLNHSLLFYKQELGDDKF